MSKYILLILILLHHSFAGAQEIDTVLVRQFSPAQYNAGIVNYSGQLGPDGLIFFSNSRGVLIYDGSEWNLITIQDEKSVQSILYDSDTLFVGGTNEFGYLVKDVKEQWQYHSMNSMIDNIGALGDIWQIVKTPDGIYFLSYNMILYYDGKTVKQIDITDSYIFSIKDYLISSSFHGDIRVIQRDSVIATLSIPYLTDDAAFSILPSLNEDEYLFFTSEHGIYKFSLDPLRISPWKSPISKQLVEDGFYNGIEYHDSLILCTTWERGIILFNKNGSIIKQIDIASGLPNRSLHELFIDENESIWIPSRSGIYQLRLSLDKVAGNFRPITTIKGISSEFGKITNMDNIYDIDYVVFDFTTQGLNLSDLEYAFFLEGHDNGWTSWSKQYRKEYNNLGNGDYVFHVKARIINTNIESLPDEVSFHIELPWYKRSITHIGAALAIVLLALLLMRIRTIRLNKSKIELEETVNIRTKELLNEREKLKNLNEELHTANIELDNFVYRSSHDLIAPLKSLRGLMTISKLEASDEKVLEYINLMETSVFKLENFINSIMEYSLNSKSETVHEEVDLNNMLDEICDEIQYFDKFSTIDFQRKIDSPRIVSDPKRLKIVLNNLITNAIKYHKTNQDQLWIIVSTEQNNGLFTIKIEDNGQGIGSEHHDKIFEMFYRASENSEGSGLGLYIVKDTMNRLNGKVRLTSTLNKGSTFILEFPST